jgi:hypothetical protein
MEKENRIQRREAERTYTSILSQLPRRGTHFSKTLIDTLPILEKSLTITKHATKQFSNRNKNAFFAPSKPLETSEKRS